jgi:hypothetical protein
LEKWLASAVGRSIFVFIGTDKNRLGFYWFSKDGSYWLRKLDVGFSGFSIFAIQQDKDATFEAPIK